MEALIHLAFLAVCGGIAYYAFFHAAPFRFTSAPQGLYGVFAGFCYLSLIALAGIFGFVIPQVVAEIMQGNPKDSLGFSTAEPHGIGRIAQFVAPVLLIASAIRAFHVFALVVFVGVVIGGLAELGS